MTVIAANLTHMAADSRQVGDVLALVDKLRLTPRGTIVGAAGDWDACLAFLAWAESGFPEKSRPSLTEGEFEALELAGDGLWLWNKALSRYRLGGMGYFAIGSGAQGAMVAMGCFKASPACAVEAVACFDESIGGPVQVMSILSLKRKRR